MTYKIKTTQTQSHISKPPEIYNQSGLTEVYAKHLFAQACYRLKLDNATENEAGGTGYDYSVEIIAE